MTKNLLYFSIFLFLISSCKNLKYSTAKESAKTPEQFGSFAATKNDSLYILSTFISDVKLKNIIKEALVNNFDARIAIQHLNMAQSQVIGFRGNLFPKLDLNVSSGMQRFGKYTMDGVGNFDTQFSPNITQEQIIPEHLPDYYAGVFMSWEADIWGKLRNRKKASVMRYLSSVEGRKWLLTLLVEDISLTYYDLLAKDMELDFLKQTIEIQANELNVVKSQKAAGRTDELVVKQFEAQLLDARGIALKLQQQINELENRLNLLMGRYPQPVDRNKMNLSDTDSNPMFSTIPVDLISNRADVKQYELMVQSTKADLKAARAAFYPSLNVNLGTGLNSFNPSYFINPVSLAYNLLGMLSTPILNRSALVADFKYHDASQIEAIYRYQEGFVRAYIEIYNQMLAINTFSEAFKLKLDEVNVLKYANDISFDLYLNGRISYLEVLYLRKNTIHAQLELIETKKFKHFAIISLFKSIGGV